MENNELNLPPFYVGQKVVYVGNDKRFSQPFYTVKDIFKLSCGCFVADLGVSTGKCYNVLVCNFHGSENKIVTSNFMFDTKFLRPLQQMKFPLISLSKVAERELCSN